MMEKILMNSHRSACEIMKHRLSILLFVWLLLTVSVHGKGESRKDDARLQNITVYHVVDTAFQKRSGHAREWPIDMNTADLHGDMYFDLG